MYDKTLKKPLEFRTKGNNSEAAIDILQKVICQVPSLFGKTCATNQKNVKSHVFLDFEKNVKKRKKTYI